MCSGAPGGMIRSKTSKCWMSFVERWGKKTEFLPLNFPRLWYNRSWANMGRSENTESASKLLVKLECQGVSDALMHCVKSVKNRRQPELSKGHWQASNQMATGLQGSYPAFRFTVSRFTRLPFFFFVCVNLSHKLSLNSLRFNEVLLFNPLSSSRRWRSDWGRVLDPLAVCLFQRQKTWKISRLLDSFRN